MLVLINFSSEEITSQISHQEVNLVPHGSV